MIDSFIDFICYLLIMFLFVFYFVFIYLIKTNIFHICHFLYKGEIVLGTVHFVFTLFCAFYVFYFVLLFRFTMNCLFIFGTFQVVLSVDLLLTHPRAR